MEEVVRVESLTKTYGALLAVDHVSLSVKRGMAFGLLGANGAGKTTTMKMVLGLLRPDQGEITVWNEPVRFGQTKTNRYIGYLPDVPEFYSYMTPIRYLALCGEIIGLSKAETQQRGEELLSLVGLGNVKKKIGGFSRGMKQRLGIAQALLTRPKLLICDEPTSALDPVGRKEILEILRKISGTTTVLFSTHILSDVERICDHAALLDRGKIVVGGTLSEIKALHGHESLLLEFPVDDALRTFKSQEAIQPLLNTAETRGKEIVLHSQEMEKVQHTVFRVLAEAELFPIKIEMMEPSLESLFLEVIR